MRKKILALIGFIIIAELAGIVGAFFTAPAISSGWYATLARPALNPPAWVFGPVWTTLYALMGISVYLIWAKGASTRLFWIHLFFNAIWSLIFFGMKNIGLALVDIFIIWIFIIILIVQFLKIDKRASYLLLPYLAWVSFASYINFALWILN